MKLTLFAPFLITELPPQQARCVCSDDYQHWVFHMFTVVLLSGRFKAVLACCGPVGSPACSWVKRLATSCKGGFQ